MQNIPIETTPNDNPQSGSIYIYPKNDNYLYSKDSSGNEKKIGGGGSSNLFISGATNVGDGSGLYKDSTYYNLNFKTLVSGENVTFNESENSITINASVSGGTGGTGGVGLISKSYSELASLISTSGLTQGQSYLLSDHQTIHLIPNTTVIHYGISEPLILLAANSYSFDKRVVSTTFPQDIIEFNFNNNICENNTTSRKGKITYRKDTVTNNSTYYDFRNVKFRRWAVDCSVTWQSNTPYTKNSLVKYNNIIYQVANTTTGSTVNPSSDTVNYIQYLDLSSFMYWSWTGNKNNFTVGPNVDKTNLVISGSTYQDYYTFCITSELDNSSGIIKTNVNGGKIGEGYKGFDIGYIGLSNGSRKYYNNIVFFLTPNGDNEYYCQSNKIGNNSFDCSIIGNKFYYNTIGNYFYSNTIGNNFYSNTIGNDFYYNTIGNNFYYNTIGNKFYSNTIGNEFYSNTIGDDFYSNTIGNYSYSNTIGNYSYSNTIGNEFNSNTIGNGFNSNTIGNNFYSNTIGNDFNSNTIGNYFHYNTIGNNFFSNTIGNNFRYNTAQDNINHINFTTATHVYNSNYNKTIFKSSDGNYKLSYCDGTNFVIVDANV